MTGAVTSDGPYAKFNALVAKTTKEVYEKGPLRKLGGDADSVAQVIEKAIRRQAPAPALSGHRVRPADARPAARSRPIACGTP